MLPRNRTALSAWRARSYAHWKATWLSFRERHNDEAGKVSKNKSRSIRIPTKFPHALYWRARLAEEEHNPAMARAFYQKLSDRFHNYYYAELAGSA